MKRSITTLLLSMLILLGNCVVGCINPGYAGEKSRANNVIRFGLFKAVEFGSEMKGKAKLIKSGNTEIQDLEFEQSPAATMANGWTAAQDSFGRSIIMPNVELNRVYGQNAEIVLNGINQIAQTVMPAVNNYLAGRTSVALAKQQTKQMQSEMIAGIAGGHLKPDEIANAVYSLPPEVTKEVLSDPVVIAKLAQLQAQMDELLNPPTSQPADAQAADYRKQIDDLKARLDAVENKAADSAVKPKDDAPPAEGAQTHGPSARAVKKPKSADLSSRKVVLWIFKYLPFA